MTRPLVLETLFSPLWSARLARQEALARVDRAKRQSNMQALHQAQREARMATCSVILLEKRHG